MGVAKAKVLVGDLLYPREENLLKIVKQVVKNQKYNRKLF
jgi:hypothetical protein